MLWSKEIASAYTQYFQHCLEEATPFDAPTSTGIVLETDDKPAPKSNLLPEDFADLNLKVFHNVEAITLNNHEYYPRLNALLQGAQKSVDLVQDYGYFYSKTPKRSAPEEPEATPAVGVAATNLLFDDLVAAHQRGLRVRTILDYAVSEQGRVQFPGEDFANRPRRPRDGGLWR